MNQPQRLLLLLLALAGSNLSVSAFQSTISLRSQVPIGPLFASSASTTNNAPKAAIHASAKRFNHGMVILTMPTSSIDRIANEAILDTAIRHTNKLSVILRPPVGKPNACSLATLRRHVGEVYSTLWDCAMGYGDIIDVVVYPQNLPNTAPEQWIHHTVTDLDMVCSHDSLIGWKTDVASGRGYLFEHLEGGGSGGLDAHVDALNADRRQRGLAAVEALHVEKWPAGASLDFAKENHVLFIDDETLEEGQDVSTPKTDNDDDDGQFETSLLGGARIPPQSLFSSVAVGGTFDGMHYGHRKLLTLAVSAVLPQTGKLMIGVTADQMLQHKQYAELIPRLDERIQGVKDFIYRLAPGMKNRLLVQPINDSFGPPGHGTGGDYDALVLSHETLDTGHTLNQHRIHNLGAKPLQLLCTRRTEPYGMSSTALRKLRHLRQEAMAGKGES